MPMRIALTTSSFAVHSDEPLEILRREGFDYVLNPHGRKLKPEETVELARGCAGLVAGTEDLGAAVLSKLPELKVLSRCGVGMDNVDQEYCRKKGILVLSTPFGPTLAVAELTVGLIIDLLREVTSMDRDLRAGVWKKRTGRQLSGKRVGVVGMGRIGQATAGLLQALGCEIAYADPTTCVTFRCMHLDELLAWADIITLHCAMPKERCPLLRARELDLMKEGSWLVNAGRGGLVDEEALYAALASGRLAGAAIDCFESEPYKGKLIELENVVLTPHIGSYAREGRIKMEIDSVRNLVEAFADMEKGDLNAG